MAINNRYKTMLESTETDSNGNAYPDILSFPISHFKAIETPTTYIFKKMDMDRFDITVYKFYGSSYYQDFIVWYNGYSSIHDIEVGSEILLPDKTEIDKFYIKYNKS